jgi:hypothetical protein
MIIYDKRNIQCCTIKETPHRHFPRHCIRRDCRSRLAVPVVDLVKVDKMDDYQSSLRFESSREDRENLSFVFKMGKDLVE